MAPKGHLKVYYGCMCSGKTTSAIVEASRWVARGDKLMVICHSSDTRSDTTLSTHSAILKVETYVGRRYIELPPMPMNAKEFQGFDVIFIDEAQFFGADIVDFIRYLVETMHKYVIVAGLDLNFMRKPFGQTLRLMSMADESYHLYAICECGKPAVYTYRSLKLGKGIIIVGGTEIYKPMCRHCWLQCMEKDAGDTDNYDALAW